MHSNIHAPLFKHSPASCVRVKTEVSLTLTLTLTLIGVGVKTKVSRKTWLSDRGETDVYTRIETVQFLFQPALVTITHWTSREPQVRVAVASSLGRIATSWRPSSRRSEILVILGLGLRARA